MSVDRQAEGTVSVATAGASDPITCTPAWPTHTTGDLGLLIVTTKHDTEATPTVTAGGGETWDSVGSASGGGGSFGAGTGPIRITVFRCVATSGSMATPTVNLAGTNTGRNMQAVICTARKTGGDSYETAVAFVAEATAGTGWTQAHTSDPGITSGDLLYCIYGVRDDQAAAFSAMGFTATGATISSVTERVDSFTAEGNDQGLGVGTANCTAGTASANGTQTATIGSSESGEMAVLRVREFTAPAGPEIAAFESSWTATTDPKTVSATSCLTDDFVVVLSGGNQDTGSDITAVDTTTSAGSTGSWTDPVEEDVSGAAADDWISSAIAQVTGDGTVTPQVELTHSGAATPTPWGMWVARVRGSAGLGVHGKTATSSTQVVSLTVEQDSAVVFLSVDWDAGSVGTFTPSGATEVERAVETATYTVHAAYWLGQDAGTRNYGHSGGGGAKYRCVAIELLAEAGGDATASPATIAATTALPQGAASVGAVPATTATVAALPQGAAGVGAAPAAVTAVGALPQAAASVGASPAVLAAVAALPQATPDSGVGGDETAEPATIAAIAALPQAAASVGAMPAVVTAAGALPQPLVGVGATPATLAGVATLPQPLVGVGAAPAVIAAVAALPTPTVGVVTSVTPATVAVVVAFPQLAVSVRAVPAVLAAVVALPQASASSPTTVVPATLAGVAAVPQAAAGVGATPATIPIVVAVLGVVPVSPRGEGSLGTYVTAAGSGGIYALAAGTAGTYAAATGSGG